MDEDTAQACWHQLELEQRYAQEQRWLIEDPAYEEWLNEYEEELNKWESLHQTKAAEISNQYPQVRMSASA